MINEFIIFAIIQFVVTCVAVYIADYVRQKAKNLATKEDISEITKEIELVKHIYKKEYDLSKTERELYNKLINSVESFTAVIRGYEKTSNKAMTLGDIEADENLSMKYLSFIEHVNLVLSHMFIFLSDDNYRRLKDAIMIDKKQSFLEIRLQLLDALRQSIHPKTVFNSKDDIRHLLL